MFIFVLIKSKYNYFVQNAELEVKPKNKKAEKMSIMQKSKMESMSSLATIQQVDLNPKTPDIETIETG